MSLGPNVPNGASGLTIGIGYDLGVTSLSQFRKDWQSFLDEKDFERLSKAIGVFGSRAVPFVDQLKDISITWETATEQFQSVTIPKLVLDLEQNLPNVSYLPPDSYGALILLSFNRGNSFDMAGDRYLEMRNIVDLLNRRKFDEIPPQIRAMKRLWPNIPALEDRRELEAKLFEKGLSKPLK